LNIIHIVSAFYSRGQKVTFGQGWWNTTHNIALWYHIVH